MKIFNEEFYDDTFGINTKKIKTPVISVINDVKNNDTISSDLKSEERLFLLGFNKDLERQHIDDQEKILVLNIECPREYLDMLSNMITCNVKMSKLKDLSSGEDLGVNLRCSACQIKFTQLDQLIEHKKFFKKCLTKINNNINNNINDLLNHRQQKTLNFIKKI